MRARCGLPTLSSVSTQQTSRRRGWITHGTIRALQLLLLVAIAVALFTEPRPIDARAHLEWTGARLGIPVSLLGSLRGRDHDRGAARRAWHQARVVLVHLAALGAAVLVTIVGGLLG